MTAVKVWLYKTQPRTRLGGVGLNTVKQTKVVFRGRVLYKQL